MKSTLILCLILFALLACKKERVFFCDQGKEVCNLSTYPNPFHTVLKMEFSSDINDSVLAQVLSLSGSTITRFQILSAKGENHHELDLSDLENGIYLIQLTSQKDNLYRKVIKQSE